MTRRCMLLCYRIPKLRVVGEVTSPVQHLQLTEAYGSRATHASILQQIVAMVHTLTVDVTDALYIAVLFSFVKQRTTVLSTLPKVS